MLRKSIGIAVVGIALLATGCASVPMASKEMDARAKSFAVKPGKANIYVYRNESLGASLKMPVTIDGVKVGETAAKTFIFKEVSPGTHKVTSQDDKSVLSVNASAGKNYFVWQEVKMGVMSGGSALSRVDDATGKKGVGECELVQ